MILRDAKLFNGNFETMRADVKTDEDKIARLGPELTETEHSIDLSGCVILPGLMDIYIHGCAGADTFDGTRDTIECIVTHLMQKGVTSSCPTTMTGSARQIATAPSAIRDCMDRPSQDTAVLGVRTRGPYPSVGRKGIQRGDAPRSPDLTELLRLYHDCSGAIRLVGVAPRCENAHDLITRASELCTVSAAHSEADYDMTMQGLQWGVTHVTHLFNMMIGFHHRQPGIVGAVFDSVDVRAELICDGLHIHPTVLRTAFRLLGEKRSITVSDSMHAVGLLSREPELGGRRISLKSGEARLADGTIAGSATSLLDGIKNLVRLGIPLRQTVRSATIDPAAATGMGGEIGSIREGKWADFTVLSEALDLQLVTVRERVVYETPSAVSFQALRAI